MTTCVGPMGEAEPNWEEPLLWSRLYPSKTMNRMVKMKNEKKRNKINKRLLTGEGILMREMQKNIALVLTLHPAWTLARVRTGRMPNKKGANKIACCMEQYRGIF